MLASPRPHISTQITAKDLETATEYDYIIVGTGTAGCVIANRLTESPDVSVLAIESGHSDLKQLFSRIPAAFARLFKSAADHDIRTTPQTGAGGRSMQWPRGKMLGGCSAINAMIFNKGAPDDYDEWEKLGNPGWAFRDIEPFMRKAECFNPNATHKLTGEQLAQHGRSGPWQIGYAHQAEFTKDFLNACDKEGIPKVQDVNSNKGINGVTRLQTFIDSSGQRSSAAVAYLNKDVASRSNLKIAVGQTVTKIVFDNSGIRPRAVGVEMASSAFSPVRHIAKAKREVIVCAGAVHTPHILKLSGIGPASELLSHGIELIKDLPAVGANLADHIFSNVTFKVTEGTSLQYLADPLASLTALIEWLRYGTGAMTSNVGEAAAFLRTADRKDAPPSLRENDLSSGKTSADLEILMGPLVFINHGATQPKKHIVSMVTSIRPILLTHSQDYASIGPIMLRPESRGTVTLTSIDPFAPPVVDANYLSTKHDIDMLIYGFKLARKISLSTDGFEGWYWPNEDVDSMSDEAIAKHVRETCETIYHPMCSAKMGPDATDSVVDSNLRVHGVDGLRIADASIFPTPLACHPCGPVIMVGEKAADLIKHG